MENTSVISRTVTASERKIKIRSSNTKFSSGHVKETLIPESLASEVDENFINYLSWNGLEREEKLLVLSSTLHYYYDYEELKDVKTVVNLKKLNLVNHLDDFLKTLYSGLSPETNFIGCFSDIKTEKVSMSSRFYKKFLNFIDAKFNVEIDGRDFSRLLESHGFKVIDMTEINGLTYFRTQNLSRSA
jgi:hypothetical protein